jgi:hypothetical protein
VSEVITHPRGRAALNTTDLMGSTPLILAALAGSVPVVQLLLEHGADFTVMDLRGLTALEAAKANDREECVEMISVSPVAAHSSPPPVHTHGDSSTSSPSWSVLSDWSVSPSCSPQEAERAYVLAKGRHLRDVGELLRDEGLRCRTRLQSIFTQAQHAPPCLKDRVVRGGGVEPCIGVHCVRKRMLSVSYSFVTCLQVYWMQI